MSYITVITRMYTPRIDFVPFVDGNRTISDTHTYLNPVIERCHRPSRIHLSNRHRNIRFYLYRKNCRNCNLPSLDIEDAKKETGIRKAVSCAIAGNGRIGSVRDLRFLKYRMWVHIIIRTTWRHFHLLPMSDRLQQCCTQTLGVTVSFHWPGNPVSWSAKSGSANNGDLPYDRIWRNVRDKW